MRNPGLPMLLLLTIVTGLSTDAQVRDREKLVPAQLSQINDANGNYWDVQTDGRINNGYNDCFDGAMYLLVNGTQFDSTSRLMRSDGREFVLARTMGSMQVTRRVWIDVKRGAARYLDVFENRQNTKTTLTVQLRTMLGGSCQQVVDSEAKPYAGGPLSKKATGICAIHPSYRPCVYFMLNGPGSSVKPQVGIQGNRTFLFSYTLTLRPRQSVSLLHVVAQRRSLPATAVPALARKFYHRRPVDVELPRLLSRTVANFRIGPVDFFDAGPLLQTVMDWSADVGVDRSQGDFLVLGEDARFKGELEGGPLAVKTRFGETDVPLSDIALLVGGNGVGRPMRLYLRNGEVILGRVATPEPCVFRGDRGLDVRLDPESLDMLIMRTDKQRDGKADEKVASMITTQDGSRLSITRSQDALLRLATPWGPIDSRLSDIGRLSVEEDPLPMFRLLLTNRSQVAVFPSADDFEVHSSRWGTIKLKFADVSRIVNLAVTRKRGEQADASEESDELPVPHCRLAGDTHVTGTIDLKSFPLRTSSGTSDVTLSEVASIVRGEGDEEFDHVELTLDNGDRMAGVLPLRFLPLRVGEHRWRVPVKHFVEARLKQEKPAAVPPPGGSENKQGGKQAAASATEGAIVPPQIVVPPLGPKR